MNNKDRNPLVLAYLGDSIYEIYIRKYLIEQGLVKVKDLQACAIKYVSAKGQASILKDLMEKGFFSEIELDIIYRARNHKSRSSKSTDIITYKHSTALEALIGYLYLEQNKDRIDEIMNYILGR